MMPPTTPHVATAQPSSSVIFPLSKRSGSQTPKKIPTAVKMPCHASVIGPKCTFGSNGIVINWGERTRRGSCHRLGAVLARRSLSVTLLELFPRSAPTRFISPRQLAWRCRGGRASIPTGRSRGRRVAGTRLRRLRLLFLLCLFRSPDGHSENRLRDSACDTRFHFLEEAVCFALVRDERVLLAVAAEIYALAQLLHRREVLDPVRVDGAEKDPSLDSAGQLVTELLLTHLVRLLDDLRDPIAQLVLVAELTE